MNRWTIGPSRYRRLIWFLGPLFTATAGLVVPAREACADNPQPNLLWIVTDDQRADSISAFNRILRDSPDSELGRVLSPNVDRLAAMGTTFINTFNQNPGCAPSRTLMHTGRYSHRSGVYGFEYYNPVGQKHWRPMFPEILRDRAGYQTLAVGKLGIRAQHFSGKGGTIPPLYETNLGYRREFAAQGLVDWNKETKWSRGKRGPTVEKFYFPDGTELVWPETADAKQDDRVEIRKRLELLRSYAPGEKDASGLILAGVNSQTGECTRDGSFVAALLDHFDHVDVTYTDMLGREQVGPTSDKPLFAFIGFDFPHTPVLPPAEFRMKFRDLMYEVPEFTQAELAAFPPQLLKLHKNAQSDHFTDDEKQQMVSDYYAFCAYGDALVGQAVDGFIEYSRNQDRPWLILYVCGDHGWRLNEHGMVSKFSHYDTDLHNPLIVVSSDKARFPAGKVVKDFTQFVDMAPTFLSSGGVDISSPEFEYLDGRDLAETVAGTYKPRQYIIAEPTWVIGPRAVIRTRDFKFAMKIRPRAGHTMTNNVVGEDFKWAVKADLEEIEPTLFDLRIDPKELRNVAFDKRYRPVLDALRGKLQDVVLGDGRVEIAWTKQDANLPAHTSEFAEGADDGIIELPTLPEID
ncbi:MAG: sulfatase-like hydrolase/transferase [Planctomycetota bacterium]